MRTASGPGRLGLGKRTLMGTGTDHAPIPKRRQENLSELR